MAIPLTVAYAPLRYAGSVKTSVRQKGQEVLAWLAKRGETLTHVWGYDPNPANPEHHSGYALDFMVFADKAKGDQIYAYLMANAKRLGIVHVLWRQTITSTVVQPGVRRPMRDRGNSTDNHMDHLHVLFKPTAYVAPVLAPPKAPTKDSRITPVDLRVDGDFGPKTRTATNRWTGRGNTTAWDDRAERALQKKVGAKVDGVVGRNTVRALQTVVGVPRADRDGLWGEQTTRYLQAYLNKR